MIKVENLIKSYGGTTNAVDSISFEVPTGDIGCLIGTSGCGKTTTLKMINRLVEPTSGKVLVNDQEAHELNVIKWRRKIGYVIQKAGLLPHLTVRENIELLAKIIGKDKKVRNERSNELLEMVGLNPNIYAKRYPVELSGGQQQRIGIARALMEDPPVLLMDEPFGALDPITRNSMHEEFLLLNQKLGKTILIVTHDMDEAFKLGNNVILMNKGKIIQQGSHTDFLNNPQNQFVEDFVSNQLQGANE